MTIAPAILKQYPGLNEAQRQIIGHSEGPLLVIAGPGSGKTFSIVLRALNLLVEGKAQPRELVLCTFTEKAAFEMRDRLSAAARAVNYQGDLSDMRVSTIHGLCNHLLINHRCRTLLGSNYETLDELTQLLFIFEHFADIIGPDEDGVFLGHWKTRWTAIEGVCSYFNKITEELVDPQRLAAAGSEFIRRIAAAYLAYETAMFDNNRTDFAHLQSIVHQLLQDPDICRTMTSGIRYVLVDEYQDTNFVQEQLLLKLAGPSGNLCAVGDEDQSLYRFRGATVRNILEFPSRFPQCAIVKLTTNYRSHRAIVERYDRWMTSADWSNPKGRPFRYDKRIEADPRAVHPDYPAVVCIWGAEERDEARRFAEFVEFLKNNQVIEDYSQVALLLSSVREEHSKRYISALEARGIPAFCPRARAFFDIREIRWLTACLAVVFGWHGNGRGETAGAVADLARYVDEGLMDLARRFAPPHPLSLALQAWTRDIQMLGEGESLDLRPADYFYRLLALEPFITAVKDASAARNLAIFSQLLNTFQAYYHYGAVNSRNRDVLRYHLFNSFLRLLHDGGINEYEDPDQPFPLGQVQVMTIHQAKGLEFPVTAVGSLSVTISSAKQLDRDLGAYYHRPPYEPENRITLFDRMRLHYVAFSRPQRVLVLTSGDEPKDHFAAIWQGLPQWPYVQQGQLAVQRFPLHERMPVKRSFSFTSDLKLYETCPRQYQFFREYNFTPSRSAVIFFGLLVHQTIEDVHRMVLDGQQDQLDEPRIRELFNRAYRFFCLSDVRPIGDAARESAFRQVLNYVSQNRDAMRRVLQTEVDVSLEKDGYILTGKVDLILGADGKLELLDFKTAPRPAGSEELIAAYERQLCTYAHILERRHGKRVDRMHLYWTSEAEKAAALMTLPYRPERIDEAGRYFDEVVGRIQTGDFRVCRTPETGICRECDLRALCAADGILLPVGREPNQERRSTAWADSPKRRKREVKANGQKE